MPGPSLLQDAHDRYMRRLENAERGALARLIRAYGEAWRGMRDSLISNLERIQKAQANPDAVLTLDMLLRDQRMRTLLDQSEAEIRRLGNLGADIAEELQKLGADSALRDSDAAMRAAWLDRVSAVLDPDMRRALADLPTWSRLPTEALRDLLGFTADGSPLASLFDTIGPGARAGWESALFKGLAMGKGPRDVAAMAQRATATGMARSLTIARTEMLRAYRTASARNYQANRDVLDGWVWLSSGDGDACASCLAMHGTVHPLGETLSSHPNCRCTMGPLTKSISDILGVDVPGGDSRLDVPAGEEIFANLSDARKLAVLGSPAALAAWKAGEVRLGDFVGVKRSSAWGSSHYQRSLTAARAAAARR